MANDLIPRYTAAERTNHWIVAITFVLAAFGGLALFHPFFFWLTNLFGGGTWTRILHPFIGVLMALFFARTYIRFRADNRITPADREWMRRSREILRNQEPYIPEVGKYNAGQKYLFKLQVITVTLLLISGIVIWQPYFAPSFPVAWTRVAVVVHAVAAFALILGIIIHVYAAIWVKGSVRAMTRGTVSRAWAKQHHPAWYRDIGRGAK